MNLMELIPLLEGTCHWEIKQILPTAPRIVPAGTVFNVYRLKNKSGFLFAAMFGGDQPLATGRMRFKQIGQLRQIVAQPYTLNLDGLTQPNGSWWTGTYSAILGYYNAIYIPFGGTQLPFDDFFEFDVIAPPAAALTISSMGTMLLVIDDKPAFWKCVRQAYSPAKFTARMIEPEEKGYVGGEKAYEQ